MADPDLSGLSTEQLLQIAKGGGATPAPAPDLSKVSNEQLQAIARGQQQPSLGYFGTQRQMAEESVGLMKQGVEQLAKPTGGNLVESAKAAALGVGALGAGAAGFVASPLNAAYRKIVGEPLQNLTGIPKEYSEFAAQLATPGIGLAGPAGKAMTAVSKVTPTVDALKAAYVGAKASPEVQAAQIPVETARKTAQTARVALNTDWLDPINAPGTFRILEKLENPPEGAAYHTMGNLRTARQRLNEIITRSSNGNDVSAAKMLKDHLDEMAMTAAPEAASAMKEANANYSRTKLMDALNSKMAKAEIAAGGANSGLNLENKLRQAAGSFLNTKEARNLTSGERDMIEQFSKGGQLPERVNRYISNLLGGGGGIGAVVVGAATGHHFAAPGIGAAMRFIGNRLAANDAAKLSQVVASNTPLGRQMQASLDAFNRVQEAASTAPGLTPRLVAQLAIQSRNLANNLKDAGIQVTPESLMGTPQPAFMGQNGNQPPQP